MTPVPTRSCARERAHPSHNWMAGTPGAVLTEVWCAGKEEEPSALVLTAGEWTELAEICRVWKGVVAQLGRVYGLVDGPGVHRQMDVADRIIEALT